MGVVMGFIQLWGQNSKEFVHGSFERGGGEHELALAF